MLPLHRASVSLDVAAPPRAGRSWSQATCLGKAIDATALKRWHVVEISRTGDIFRRAPTARAKRCRGQIRTGP